MESFGELFKAVSTAPTAALLVLSLLANGWLVKRGFDREKEFADQSKVDAKSASDAQLTLAMSVLPLTQKLVTCVELVTAKGAA